MRLRMLALAAVVVLTVTAEVRDAQAAPADAMVQVIKPYGAALRIAPGNESPIAYTAMCGELLPILSVRDGWYQVATRARTLWVAADRVADPARPPLVDCFTGLTFPAYAEVVVDAPFGCATLRTAPSLTAAAGACLQHGQPLVIQNGPVEGSGQDWFQVTGPSGAGGWIPARALNPRP